MINWICQLTSPQTFSLKYSDINVNKNMIIRPKFMSICRIDRKCYLGKYDLVPSEKLPLLLIHECCGSVVHDETDTFQIGQKVVIVPNNCHNNCSNGFMREFIEISTDDVIPFNDIPMNIAVICDSLSIAVHAVNKFIACTQTQRKVIAIWGDNELSYITSLLLKTKFRFSKIIIIGKNPNKLSYFTFADEIYLLNDLPKNLHIDHAFECIESNDNFYTINDMINNLNPFGTLILMSYNENKIAINTKIVLEKGLTLVGCSGSNKKDFLEAINLMAQKDFQNRLSYIIHLAKPVNCLQDVYRVFNEDVSTIFKTVFEWKM